MSQGLWSHRARHQCCATSDERGFATEQDACRADALQASCGFIVDHPDFSINSRDLKLCRISGASPQLSGWQAGPDGDQAGMYSMRTKPETSHAPDRTPTIRRDLSFAQSARQSSRCASMQKKPRHLVLPDRGGHFSITSAPLGRIFDSLARFRVKLTRPAG